jgi:Domain of unknown function (DUF4158)
VAQQLGVAPQALTAYGTRRPTRTTDFQHVQAHLHFRLATPLDMYALQTWLGERALEHDKPTLLLQLACDKLRREEGTGHFRVHAEHGMSTIIPSIGSCRVCPPQYL